MHLRSIPVLPLLAFLLLFTSCSEPRVSALTATERAEVAIAALNDKDAKYGNALWPFVTHADPSVREIAMPKFIAWQTSDRELPENADTLVAAFLISQKDCQALSDAVRNAKYLGDKSIEALASIALDPINCTSRAGSTIQKTSADILARRGDKRAAAVAFLLCQAPAGPASLSKAATDSLLAHGGPSAADCYIRRFNEASRDNAVRLMLNQPRVLRDPRAIPGYVRILTHRFYGERALSELRALNWIPTSTPDRVHSWIVAGDRRKLTLPENRQDVFATLRDDLASTDRDQAHHSVTISLALGIEELRPHLTSCLVKWGSAVIAEQLLNSGDPDLAKFAREWATALKYSIQTTTGNSVRWGSWR